MPNTIYAPDTDLRLLSVPLTKGDGHQIDFATAAAQTAYFQGKTVKIYADFYYQRKDHYIDIPDVYDNLLTCNYVMYRNTSHGSKWFYAFIDKMEFVNQNVTRVYISTDVFQTWLFDFTFKQCIVRREHTPTDNAYEHTLPEPIQTGDIREIYRNRATPFSISAKNDTEFDTNYRVIFCLAEPYGNTELVGNMFGGVPKSVYYYGVDRTNVRAFVRNIIATVQGAAESIIAVYPVPISALNWTSVENPPDDIAYYLPYDKGVQTVTVSTPTGSTISGVGTFKNKKMLCYPYHFYRLHSANGRAIDLKPQDFNGIASDNQITLQTVFSGAVSPSLLVTPQYYRYNNYGTQGETGANYEYSIDYTDFPQIAVKTDVYQNYIALNQSAITLTKSQIGMQFVRGAANLAGGAGIGSILSASDSAFRYAATMSDMERQPDKVQGTPQGNALIKSGGAGIFLSEMCVKQEYFAMADQYFTMYGYNVSELKTPQFKSRPNHNYLETQNCDIVGDIPADDSAELRAMFDGGLTVWHNPAHFGDYSQNNAPV